MEVQGEGGGLQGEQIYEEIGVDNFDCFIIWPGFNPSPQLQRRSGVS